MSKTPRRKPPKKKHPKQPQILDDDLNELASVLDEHRLENNALGWFSMPWHNGWNAIELAHNYFIETDNHREDVKECSKFLNAAIKTRTLNAETYWQIGELLQKTVFENANDRCIYTALRCLQVMISNSSGGGDVYNVLLKLAFEKSYVTPMLEELVLEYRCRDAIRTTSHLQGDRHDRARRAFSIAWKRGLYLAAYSIAPVISDEEIRKL